MLHNYLVHTVTNRRMHFSIEPDLSFPPNVRMAGLQTPTSTCSFLWEEVIENKLNLKNLSRHARLKGVTQMKSDQNKHIKVYQYAQIRITIFKVGGWELN